MDKTLLFLGTGHGMPKRSTSAALFLEADGQNILLDVAGGQEVVRQFYTVGRNPTEVQNIFISHCDSDHVLGIVPLVRVFRRAEPRTIRTIYCSAYVKQAIESLFTYVAKNHFDGAHEFLKFVVVEDGQTLSVGNWQVTFFDVKSDKNPEMGCKIVTKDGTSVTFLGDEPMRDHYLDVISGSDYLIHEAFCLDKDETRFKPHEKNHGTVAETAKNATKAKAKHLVLFHMEDDTLETRKTAYAAEVAQHFSGPVTVPVDGDILTF